jgi:hypothetical protein
VRTGILSAIKAPLGVQFIRVAFTIYTAFFAWPPWHFRNIISESGLLIFNGFVFCSLLGLGYSFVRLPRSRWILATLGLAIPAAFWTSMCLMEFSRPVLWEWPLDAALVIGVWFGYPIALAVALFREKKTREFFTGPP